MDFLRDWGAFWAFVAIVLKSIEMLIRACRAIKSQRIDAEISIPGVHHMDRKLPELWSNKVAQNSKGFGDWKKLMTAMIAVTLHTFGAILLSHYILHDINRSSLGRTSLGDAEFAAESRVSGHDWYADSEKLFGQNFTNKFIYLLSNPTPGMLMFGLATYGLGASAVYHFNCRDKYQDPTLAAGIVLGACLGIFYDMDGQIILLRILPWAIHIALSLSDIGHRICDASYTRHSSSNKDSL